MSSTPAVEGSTPAAGAPTGGPAPGDTETGDTDRLTGSADPISAISAAVETAAPERDAGPTAAPRLPPGALLAAVRRGFVVAGSHEQVAPRAAGRFQVWAEPDATRSAGRWLAVTTASIVLSSTEIVPFGARESVAGHPAVITFGADGIPVLTVQPAGLGQFSLTGGGFGVDELRQLGAALTLDDGVPSFDPAVEDLRRGMPLVLDTTSEFGGMTQQLLRGPGRVSTYLSQDGEQIQLVTQTTTADDLRIGELILPPSSDSLATLSTRRTVQMGELELSISTAPGDGPAAAGSSLRWHAGPDTITLSGTTGLHRLLAAAPDVRLATGEEWRALLSTPAAPVVSPPVAGSPPTPRPDPIQIGRDTTADGTRWTISVRPDTLAIRIEVSNESAAGPMGELPRPQPTVRAHQPSDDRERSRRRPLPARSRSRHRGREQDRPHRGAGRRGERLPGFRRQDDLHPALARRRQHDLVVRHGGARGPARLGEPGSRGNRSRVVRPGGDAPELLPVVTTRAKISS